MRRRSNSWRTGAAASVAVVGVILAFGTQAAAQVAVKVEAAAPAAQATPQPMPPSGQPQPGGPGKPGESKPGEAKPGESTPGQPGGAPMPEKPPTVRPAQPAKPANPDELRARPDADGLISFSFKGQPWPAVLEWLADISGMSLDWQEAPPDYLDLTTRGRYKVDEVRDLINSALLSRGFTLLRNGEILMVVNLKKLDTSLVPRVTAKELDGRGAHELVKMFFDLNRLRAEVVVEEFKPLLSPNGKIAALKTTNRLDVMDTAGNLRRLRDLLAEEQTSSGQSLEIRPYYLKHTRAAEVVQTLNTLLGIKPKGGAMMPMSPDQMQQMMQMQQQQMQQMQQMQQAGQAGGAKPQESEILLAVNARENAILAHATPDKLAIIEQTIKLIDVPQHRGATGLANVQRVQVYRLAGVDPEPIVKVLQETGDLDPTTRIDIDQKNRALIVNGPLADHVTVRALVDKIDGSSRRFEVIQLRRLDAEYVAGSIEFLMRGPQENKQQRQRYYFYDYFDSSRSGDSTPKDGDKFQVEADTENNRLLLRANNIELQEVRDLLVKLGEISERDDVDATLRVIPTAPGAETEELLERIRRLWPSVAPNPLEVDPPPPETKSTKENERPANLPRTEPAGIAPDTEARSKPRSIEGRPRMALASIGDNTAAPAAKNEPAVDPELEADDASRVARSAPGERPPVSITRGPQGLVITSQDPVALERMMELAANVRARPMTRKVFTLRHTYAKDVATLLEDVFADDDSKKKTDTFSRWYYYDEPPQQQKNERDRLSKRRPLKFVPDPVTNTILVQGADAEQLAEIARLIEIYDRVEPPDSQSVRRTQMIAVKYSNAQVIAEVVKDVYRDLLSPNDKALQAQQQQQQQEKIRSPFSFFDFGPRDSDGADKQNAPRFKGLLSVGVDTKANMLVVSAPQYLLDNVEKLVAQLDESAKPLRSVVKLSRVRGVNESRIRDALSNIASPGSKPRPGETDASQKGQQPDKPGQQPGQPGQPNQGNQQPGQAGQGVVHGVPAASGN